MEQGGGDLIIIYNSGRYRMAGRGSLAGLMPYGNANDVVLEMIHSGQSPRSLHQMTVSMTEWLTQFRQAKSSRSSRQRLFWQVFARPTRSEMCLGSSSSFKS